MFFLRMYVLVTPLVAATNMADVHFSFKFGFECRERHGRLVFESAFSAQVLVRAKDSLRFRTLAFASAEANW
uniref:Putative secreted protein n=1 Tax=Ixodes ricinus TaxID=34613 RepID=A0A6B0U259_IXORI